MSGQKGKVHLGPNVNSSARYRGCVVNGSGAMAAIWILLLLLHTSSLPETQYARPDRPAPGGRGEEGGEGKGEGGEEGDEEARGGGDGGVVAPGNREGGQAGEEEAESGEEEGERD